MSYQSNNWFDQVTGGYSAPGGYRFNHPVKTFLICFAIGLAICWLIGQAWM